MAKKTKRKAVKKAKPVKKAIKKAAKKIVAKKAKPVKKAKKAAVSRAPKLSPEQLMMKVQNKVEGFLKKMYKSTFEKHEDGRFLVFEGTTAIQTVIRPWHENDVVVESFSYVVQNANIDDNLMKFLLRENAVIHFGAFGLTFDGTIIFNHSLAGANLDENEFTASIKSVARIADYYDERIVQMAGGMTAREAMKQGIM